MVGRKTGLIRIGISGPSRTPCNCAHGSVYSVCGCVGGGGGGGGGHPPPRIQTRTGSSTLEYIEKFEGVKLSEASPCSSGVGIRSRRW
jgi:hypothetical protein